MRDEVNIERLDEGWLLRTNKDRGNGADYRRLAAQTFAQALSRTADVFGYRIAVLELVPIGSMSEPEGVIFTPAPDLTPEQEAYIAATDPPDPIDVLNVDKPLTVPGEVGN